MKIASLATVKTHFSAYIKSAEEGGPIVVTRNGKPVAVLIGVTDEEELDRPLMAHSPRLQAILDAARKRIEAGKGIPSEEFWEQVEAEHDVKKPRSKPQKRT